MKRHKAGQSARNDQAMHITIYGVGTLCRRSRLLEVNVRRALKEMDVQADIRVVVDFKQMVDTEIRYLPALTVNGHIVLQGGILTVARLKKRLQPLLKTRQF